jgi:hypothetical protein
VAYEQAKALSALFFHFLLREKSFSQLPRQDPAWSFIGTPKHEQRINTSEFLLYDRCEESSVADPCHFGVDLDPDPRIHASD